MQNSAFSDGNNAIYIQSIPENSYYFPLDFVKNGRLFSIRIGCRQQQYDKINKVYKQTKDKDVVICLHIEHTHLPSHGRMILVI